MSYIHTYYIHTYIIQKTACTHLKKCRDLYFKMKPNVATVVGFMGHNVQFKSHTSLKLVCPLLVIVTASIFKLKIW